MNPRRTLISKENTIGAAIGALALGANAAQADSGLFYFGAGITTLCCKGMITPNINSASWKVFAGFRPISQFAVEVDYYDLVPYDFCLRKYLPLLSLGCEGFREFRGGIPAGPLPYLGVYGKAGVARSQLSGSRDFVFDIGEPYSNEDSDNSTAFDWGAGVQLVSAKSEGGWPRSGLEGGSRRPLL